MDQLRAEIAALTQSLTQSMIQLGNQLTDRLDQVEARLTPLEENASPDLKLVLSPLILGETNNQTFTLRMSLEETLLPLWIPVLEDPT